jgi:hypothetical protein
VNLEVFSDGSALIKGDGIIDGDVCLDSRELRELRDRLLEAFPPGLAGPKVEYTVLPAHNGTDLWNVRRVERNAEDRVRHVAQCTSEADARRIVKALTEAEGL